MFRLSICLLLLFVLAGCAQKEIEVFDRESRIPGNATKITPEMDLFPPQLHSDEWEAPVPLPYPISTRGAEDSAFITPDGKLLYFFFTPDPAVPAEKQLVDGVTGIYVSKKQNNVWSRPERVILNDDLSLDGCEFVDGNLMWFCSARRGNYRGVDIYTAEFRDGNWTAWKNAGEKLNAEYGIGEMHLHGNELYFHSDRPGGKGGVDIWLTRNAAGEWQEPENVGILNSGETDGWPFVTSDGKEFWFLRTYLGTPAIYRSKKLNGSWSEPELIISQFAGEPSVDDDGNIYFTHHFFKDAKMLEADIYVAYRK